MTTQEKYNLSQWAIETALKKGAQHASAAISGSGSNQIEVREGRIDKLEQANQNSLSIRLFVDGRYSAHSTNRLKKPDLERFIGEAVAATRYLSEDTFRTLPDPVRYYKGGGPRLNTLDQNYPSIDPQKKVDIAFALEKEVAGKDERIISVSANYTDGMGSRVLVDSNGFKGETANSFYAVWANVSVKGGDARPSAGWSESALFFDRLKCKGVGQTALDRALRKIGQRKIASERMPMIVENISAPRLLSPVISALNGAAVQQKNSFLIGKLGEKVASDVFNIVDDPFIPDGRASRLFDNEGMAVRKMTVFEKGTLKTYYIDTYYGKKLEWEPTTGSTSNLILAPGDKTLAQLIKTLKRGILVTGFNGGNSNGATGDFSFGIDGFLVENGEIVQPVSEMNITGNLLTLWTNLAAVANDPREDSAWRVPSLLFNDVDFSGI